MIYLLGSLSNPRIPEIEKDLRSAGFDVFAEWHAAGPKADEEWQRYFKSHGYTLRDALASDFVQTAYNFDRTHIEESHTLVAIAPFGRSGGIELGVGVGTGKRTYILYPDGDPERWDLMLAYADCICYSVDELKRHLRGDEARRR